MGMFDDMYLDCEAIAVFPQEMDELIELGVRGPSGVFYCMRDGGCTVSQCTDTDFEFDDFNAEAGRAIARLAAAHARREDAMCVGAGLDDCFSQVVCELAPAAASALERELKRLVEYEKHGHLAETMNALRGSIHEDADADLAIFELVGMDGLADSALLEAVAVGLSEGVSRKHGDEVLSAESLSDFIFDEFLKPHDPGVDGKDDLASMERSACSIASQAEAVDGPTEPPSL